MAVADMKAELNCSICKEIYTDPVTLLCGHSFCLGCIKKPWDSKEDVLLETLSCPECTQRFGRRPTVRNDLGLFNIVEDFHPGQSEKTKSIITCTYCDYPVPATQSCVLCEVSLCDNHLRDHSKSTEHVLTQPTTSFEELKCSVHKKILEYYCTEDGELICESCNLTGKHREHRVDLPNEAFEKKKEELRKALDKLKPEREEMEKTVLSLREHKKSLHGKVTSETERVNALFNFITKQFHVIEEGTLSEITKQEEEVSLRLTNLIQRLEIKQDELSCKIHHTEELCNLVDPLTVLQDRESVEAGTCNDDNKEVGAINIQAVGNLDMNLISHRMFQGLDVIMNQARAFWGIQMAFADSTLKQEDKQEDNMVPFLDFLSLEQLLFTEAILLSAHTNMKTDLYGQEANDLLLDINTAGNHMDLSRDMKTAYYSLTDQGRPNIPGRFQLCQILSAKSFSAGRHYWDVEVSEFGQWRIGAAYRSLATEEYSSLIGYNNMSWVLYISDNSYVAAHGYKEIPLSLRPTCRRIRVSLDYESGSIAFFELSFPVTHLHTFAASFSEPLHAAFWVGTVFFSDDAWVKIIS